MLISCKFGGPEVYKAGKLTREVQIHSVTPIEQLQCSTHSSTTTSKSTLILTYTQKVLTNMKVYHFRYYAGSQL